MFPPGTTVDIESEVRDGLRAIEEFLRNLPVELPAAAPLTLPGGVALLTGLLASMPWWGYWEDPRATDAAARVLNTVGRMQAPTTDTQALRYALALNSADYQALLAFAAAQPGAALGLEVMPSPAAVAQASGPALADAVARIAVWERAHHGLVHGGLADAQGRVDAATAAVAAATESSAVETVRAIRGIVDVILPDAVLELTTIIRQLKAAQQTANAQLAHDLDRTARELAQRIGDLVRWLTTEALPDLEEQLKAERLARKKEAADLRVGIATEVDDRTSADASLLTQVAPLLAWASAFGVHTTEKVKRNEDVLDQLPNLNLGAFMALTSLPMLTALTGKMIADLLPHAGDILGGFEDAASKALGAIW